MIKNKISKKQKGFTIIELMIATTVFSLVLMVCLAGILRITKMYYRSVTQNKTREVARSVVDEIGEAIRFTNQPIQIGTTIIGPQINDTSKDADDTGYFCVGKKRYTYALDRQVKTSPKDNTKQKRHALWLDKPLSCNGPASLADDIPTADGKDLLPENMRLYNLSVASADSSNDTYKISVGVAYGDDDLLSPRPDDKPTELSCEGAFVGVEFCATTNLSVTVQKRL